jgi:hypothetical protein
MDVDEEILRENAMSERRYILTVLRQKIVEMRYEFEDEDFYASEGSEAFDDTKIAVLEIIDRLISTCQ